MANRSATAVPLKDAPSRLSDLTLLRGDKCYAAEWRRNLSFAALAIEVVVIAMVIGARLR